MKDKNEAELGKAARLLVTLADAIEAALESQPEATDDELVSFVLNRKMPASGTPPGVDWYVVEQDYFKFVAYGVLDALRAFQRAS
jgi:hypothetical protein